MPDDENQKRPTRRKSDRWQQWTAIIFMAITGVAGLAIIGLWLGWHVAHLLGAHGGPDHASQAPLSVWDAILGSTAFFLVSSVFAGGSPGKTGKNMMDAIISRVRGGDG